MFWVPRTVTASNWGQVPQSLTLAAAWMTTSAPWAAARRGSMSVMSPKATSTSPALADAGGVGLVQGEAAYFVPSGQELLQKIAADEAAGARDQYLHD